MMQPIPLHGFYAPTLKAILVPVAFRRMPDSARLAWWNSRVHHWHRGTL